MIRSGHQIEGREAEGPIVPMGQGHHEIIAKPSLDSNKAWAIVQAVRRRERALRDAAEQVIEDRGYIDNPKDPCLLDREKLRAEAP